MWVHREAVAGGFDYVVYRNDALTHVSWMGTCYLYNIGWHPTISPFVSADDDAILHARGLIREEEVRTASARPETIGIGEPAASFDF